MRPDAPDSRRRHFVPLIIAPALLVGVPGCAAPGADEEAGPDTPLTFAISIPETAEGSSIDGRVILILAADDETEPRFQVGAGLGAPQVFGIDVEGLTPGESVVIDADVFGFPKESLAEVPPGEYSVQAVLHEYQTFDLATGHTVKLPMDRGEGQRWSRAPGNLYSTPRRIRIDPADARPIEISLDQVILPIEEPEDTEYIKHVRVQSDLLTEFWGRPMYLGAHVLLPEGFDENPDARYPLVVFHGHFPSDFGGFRTEPPDPDLECEYSERFDVECYNRIVQQEAYDSYRSWISEEFPRFIIIEIQHANPYYDDSYAVNSANLGPYGDAITHELIPYIEERVPRDRRGMGPLPLRRLHGRLGGSGRSGFLPGRVQRHLRRLSRIRSTFGPTRSSTSTRTERLLRRRPLQADRAAGAPELAGRGRPDAGGIQPPGAGRWERRTAPGTSSTSGKPSTHRRGMTATRSGSGTSAPGRSTTRSPSTGGRTTTCATSSSGTGRRWGPSWRGRSTSTSATWTTITSTMPST